MKNVCVTMTSKLPSARVTHGCILKLFYPKVKKRFTLFLVKINSQFSKKSDQHTY